MQRVISMVFSPNSLDPLISIPPRCLVTLLMKISYAFGEIAHCLIMIVEPFGVFNKSVEKLFELRPQLLTFPSCVRRFVTVNRFALRVYLRVLIEKVWKHSKELSRLLKSLSDAGVFKVFVYLSTFCHHVRKSLKLHK